MFSLGMTWIKRIRCIMTLERSRKSPVRIDPISMEGTSINIMLRMVLIGMKPIMCQFSKNKAPMRSPSSRDLRSPSLMLILHHHLASTMLLPKGKVHTWSHKKPKHSMSHRRECKAKWPPWNLVMLSPTILWDLTTIPSGILNRPNQAKHHELQDPTLPPCNILPSTPSSLALSVLNQKQEDSMLVRQLQFTQHPETNTPEDSAYSWEKEAASREQLSSNSYVIAIHLRRHRTPFEVNVSAEERAGDILREHLHPLFN